MLRGKRKNKTSPTLIPKSIHHTRSLNSSLLNSPNQCETTNTPQGLTEREPPKRNDQHFHHTPKWNLVNPGKFGQPKP